MRMHSALCRTGSWMGVVLTRPLHSCGHNFDKKMAADTGGASIVRRNRPGTKAKDMYNWPDQDFNDMETVLAGMTSGGGGL